ncbi:MAG: hypothetical protein A2017_13495 [Lentisphaerae bacterium GWF2_44_16]|nr:MAG: hypothetical protein A2017_13495 [Lentisphaerae bacterium GWF2_44_16]
MQVKAHVLREIKEPVKVPLSTLGYRDFTSNEDWYHNLISFTSLRYLKERDSVLCGMTSFDTDIMYEFSCRDKKFRCLDYGKVSEKFEIKIHRSLHIMKDGSAIGATACLHREDQRGEGPGGRIFRLDIEKANYDFLGIPVEYDYIQTITVDEKRGLIYGFTYPVFNFFVFDMKKRKNRRVDYVGSIPHIVALDDKGRYWATWNNRTHNLFRYDPDNDKMEFFQHNLPQTKNSCSLMYPGAGPIDGMINGGDGFLYIGEAYGNIDRLNPETGEVYDIGKPLPGETRIPALEKGPDGRLYGIAGFLGRCHLFSMDLKNGKFEDLGHIRDSETGEALFIGHDLCFAGDGTIFIGETDTAHRAGYLWECKI